MDMERRKYSRREAGILFLGLAAAAVLIEKTESPFTPIFSTPTPASNTPKVPIETEAQRAVKDVSQVFENIMDDQRFINLINPDLRIDAALNFSLASFYKTRDGVDTLSYFEQIRNETNLDDPALAVSLTTIGEIKGWTTEDTLRYHQVLSSLGRSTPSLGAMLLSTAAASDLFNAKYLYDEVYINKLVAAYELAPILVSAASMRNNLDQLRENYIDILDNAAGKEYVLGTKMLVLSEYDMGGWMKIGSEYTNVVAKEAYFDIDQSGCLGLVCAGLLSGNRTDKVWEMYDYAKELKYNPYIASRLTLLSAVRASKFNIYGEPSRGGYLASDILMNWDLPVRPPSIKSKYSLV